MTSAPEGPSDEVVAEYQKRYGLSYHVPFALGAEALVGLRGQKVLEVGGSLPEGFVRDVLGVRAWFAIEELSYWHEIEASGGVQGTPPGAVARSLETASVSDIESGYGVFAGRIESLPVFLHGQFDVAFSIAAFEHIDRLALTLDAVYAALRPGGRLFALFAPIWSAHDGHHLPQLRDRSGRLFDFHNSPVPAWGHLLLRPPQMFELVKAHTDRETASDIVYYVYHSRHINRLFSEDYVAYCRASPLTIERCDPVFPHPPPPEVQRELERYHPGRKQFANNGLLVILRKPGGTS